MHFALFKLLLGGLLFKGVMSTAFPLFHTLSALQKCKDIHENAYYSSITLQTVDRVLRKIQATGSNLRYFRASDVRRGAMLDIGALYFSNIGLTFFGLVVRAV